MLSGLTQDQARELEERWRFWLRDEQHAPEGSWRIWLFLGGRGAGKTLAGAHWLASNIWAGHMRRVGLIGATHHDARSVMVEGESGLLQLCKDVTYEPTNRRLTFPSGAIVSVLSADEPDSLRGPQFDGLWLDEFAKWPEPQAALDMALMCLRIGADPRMAITTTPRAIPSVKALLASPDVVVTRSATEANAGNLAPGFLDTMRARYLGSRLGRQELDGEVIEDNDAALWRRSWIDAHRLREAPELSRIVVAVDPPVSTNGDECGIVVAGLAENGHVYVLADCSADGLTPAGWAGRVADAFETHEADLVVAEVNQGGDMVRAMLHDVVPDVRVKICWSRFKYHDQTHDDWNYGFIAQDIQARFGAFAPELVDGWDDLPSGTGLLAVYHEDLHNIGHAVLSAAQRRIEAMENENATLKATLAETLKRVAALESR